MNCNLVDNISRQELINLTNGYLYGRYLEDKDLPYDASFLLFTDSILKLISQEQSQTICITSSNGNL